MDLDYVKFKVKPGRREKRKATLEHEKFLCNIEPLEVSFCANIFDTSISLTYAEIYLLYLQRVIEVIGEMNKRFTVIRIDKYYFEKRYSPIESL